MNSQPERFEGQNGCLKLEYVMDSQDLLIKNPNIFVKEISSEEISSANKELTLVMLFLNGKFQP